MAAAIKAKEVADAIPVALIQVETDRAAAQLLWDSPTPSAQNLADAALAASEAITDAEELAIEETAKAIKIANEVGFFLINNRLLPIVLRRLQDGVRRMDSKRPDQNE